MTRAGCATPPQELLAYWLGELDEAREQSLEEHVFACAACTKRLAAIVDLGAAIRTELLGGAFSFVTSAPFIRRIKDAGWQVREYDLPAGGSVACTVTPDDDFVVSYLRAPLRDVRRLDVLIDDTTSGKHRVNDVAFDSESGTLAAVTSTVYVKGLGPSQRRVRLVAVDGVEERVIADYTFNHSPS
ncbi:MAG TPA: zf-HC2 domain-containing protein [Gammaproteobacteria bacterium]|nr:zf-HC2 domain-containing protein [Gammaproteobacteria bacterium]